MGVGKLFPEVVIALVSLSDSEVPVSDPVPWKVGCCAVGRTDNCSWDMIYHKYQITWQTNQKMRSVVEAVGLIKASALPSDFPDLYLIKNRCAVSVSAHLWILDEAIGGISFASPKRCDSGWWSDSRNCHPHKYLEFLHSKDNSETLLFQLRVVLLSRSQDPECVSYQSPAPRLPVQMERHHMSALVVLSHHSWLTVNLLVAHPWQFEMPCLAS